MGDCYGCGNVYRQLRCLVRAKREAVVISVATKKADDGDGLKTLGGNGKFADRLNQRKFWL